jgi:hypothetical protein
MQIRISSFAQTRGKYAGRIILNYFRSRWIFILMLWIIAGMQFSLHSKWATAFIVFAALFPITISAFLYFLAGTKNMAWYYKEKALRIDESGLKVDFADGRKEKIKWDQVRSIRRSKDGFMLFNDPPLYLYIPNETFADTEGPAEFEAFLKEKGFLKK